MRLYRKYPAHGQHSPVSLLTFPLSQLLASTLSFSSLSIPFLLCVYLQLTNDVDLDWTVLFFFFLFSLSFFFNLFRSKIRSIKPAVGIRKGKTSQSEKKERRWHKE